MDTSDKIFISSCFVDPKEPIEVPLKIRSLILKQFGNKVWMAEQFEELEPTSSLTAFEKLEMCLDGVRQCKYFVAIISTRFGSPIDIGTKTVHSSFFEMELFEASLLNKPSLIFQLEDHSADKDITNLLNLLKNISSTNFKFIEAKKSSDEIIREIDKLINRRTNLNAYKVNINSYVDGLFYQRHINYDLTRELPNINFLNNLLIDSEINIPEKNTLDTILAKARDTENNYYKLSLLWMAIRLLRRVPFSKKEFEAFRPYWIQTLEDWGAASAWYQLHGHIYLGYLASLVTLAKIKSTNIVFNPYHGSIASEYYSISKLSSKYRMPILLNLALPHINLSIEKNREHESIGVRGSIYRELGDYRNSIDDFKTILNKCNPNSDDYAFNLNELGYSQFLSGDKKGIEKMEKSITLFKNKKTSNIIRAKRKLAIAYVKNFKILSAIDLVGESREMANELGIYPILDIKEKTFYNMYKAKRWAQNYFRRNV